MDQIFSFRIDDRDLLRDLGFRLFKLQTLFAPSKSSGARDPMTRGSWIWMTEIHFGSLGHFGTSSTSSTSTLQALRVLPVQTMDLDDLLPLTTICDNIWLHRGWHAPCDLQEQVVPVTFCIGLWSQAQNTLLRNTG
jgi:hypothetical protein